MLLIALYIIISLSRMAILGSGVSLARVDVYSFERCTSD